ncbi:MAG: DUF302 domain-containing protein [Hyphomicrobiaceae bacterium]|nr:DUF302 domain-containing protein [Hyphomicrobiaceae bacterium]
MSDEALGHRAAPLTLQAKKWFVATPILFAFAIAFMASVVRPGAAEAGDAVQSVRITRAFGDARVDLQAAIVNQGLNIDYNGRVGEMLKRTGPDVGSSVEIYREAEYFTFCSSRLSRAMMEADPLNAGLCPYVMFVFESAATPGEVTVGYRVLPVGADANPATTKALGDIDALLSKILAEATD